MLNCELRYFSFVFHQFVFRCFIRPLLYCWMLQHFKLDCTSTTFGVTRACSVEDFGVSDLVTQILSVVRFSRYIFDHWLRPFFIGLCLCATQIFKGWRMGSMKRNIVTIVFRPKTGRLDLRGRHNNNWGK